MSGTILRILTFLTLFASISAPALSQFGQNKISYETFDWQVYSAPHFDVHYYPSEEPFLEEVVSYAESAYLKISRDLDHELRFRVPLVVYKTHGEFQRTNITMAELPEGVGAFAEPVQYRMVLPIDLPPDELYKLISHELVHIFQYSIFYEGYLGRALRSRPPTWLMEGMASYLAEDESNLDRMAIRDAVVNNILPRLEQLNVLTFLTYRYGHAIFDFIEQEHGKEGMRSFIFEYKKVLLANNLRKAIKEAFGYEIDEFDRRFNRYLRKKYFPVLLEKKSPDDYGSEIADRKRRDVPTVSPSISPSGELIAALSAPGLELDLVVIAAEDGSQVKNLTKGWTNKYRYLVTEIFNGKRDLSWSPTSDRIAVFARKENGWPLLIYNALNGKLVREIKLDNIYECSGPAYSPDGRRIAFEGNRDGVVDLFEIDLESGELRNLTQDDFFDANPWYSADGRTLLYNRRIGPHWKIFSVDLSDPSKKTQLTFGANSDLQPSYSRDGQTVYFTSDRGPYGIFNLHSLDLATGDIKQYTDLVGGCFSPVEMADRDDERYIAYTAFFQGSFRLYRMPLRSPELEIVASERLADVAEAEPFEPALQLRADEDKKKPYKLKWDIDAPSISVGVADDGTLLSNVGIQFSDLMGNHRIFISAGSVSDYGQYNVTYINQKRRFDWGASAYDFRDYFVDYGTGTRLEQLYRFTGADFFVQYPFSRHYRVQGSVGVVDSSIPVQAYDPEFGYVLAHLSDTLTTVGVSLTGDTTRFQSFGPFQGKRFTVSAKYGKQISGDFDGDWTEYRADFRAYKQLTRRSLFAWRLATVYNAGEREYTYGFGGLNQLRGYEFREFRGSRIAWSNLEFRFPLVDEMRFPVFALRQIRGFFFLDVGAAWYQDNLWYDPALGGIRADYRPLPDAPPEPIGFKFWDSENNRLQDGRASYGAGFQFFFIGGLQFNWVWSKRMDYTQYVYDLDGTPIKIEGDTSGTRSDFYIQFDF
jgi:WD40 repeat protein